MIKLRVIIDLEKLSMIKMIKMKKLFMIWNKKLPLLKYKDPLKTNRKTELIEKLKLNKEKKKYWKNNK
tara:strand:- start:115 stop:318 length:204 start_codon:yes stop_codon:yes gene_type:complete